MAYEINTTFPSGAPLRFTAARFQDAQKRGAQYGEFSISDPSGRLLYAQGEASREEYDAAVERENRRRRVIHTELELMRAVRDARLAGRTWIHLCPHAAGRPVHVPNGERCPACRTDPELPPAT